MRFNIPEADPEDVLASDVAQKIIERLARARWITGTAHVSPREVKLQLTELGKAKVAKLAKYLRPFEGFCFEVPKPNPTRWEFIKLLVAIRWHGLALWRPLPSHLEEMTLIAVLACEARQHRLR